MLMKIFSVYDSKAEAFLQPFFMSAKGQAIRAFTDLVSDSNHQFGKYSADYTLFELGAFNDASATFDILAAPVSLGNGVEFKKDS